MDYQNLESPPEGVFFVIQKSKKDVYLFSIYLNYNFMKKKLIIIEDDRPMRSVLEMKLKDQNVDILAASDGEMGLKMAQDEKPDLILLDLILPKMHGFKVLENLKSNPSTKDIPVIILSNLGQEEEEEKGRELGAKDYFVKAETSLDKISKTVTEVLGL